MLRFYVAALGFLGGFLPIKISPRAQLALFIYAAVFRKMGVPCGQLHLVISMEPQLVSFRRLSEHPSLGYL
jgi:hypothetical protein